MRAPPGAGMSRSNKRRRHEIIRARVTPEEKKLAEKKAETMGSMGTLFRASVLGYSPPRLADRDVIVKLLGALSDLGAEFGKIGSNLNQIAHRYNIDPDRPPTTLMESALIAALDEWNNAVRTLDELRLVNMQSLGLELDREIADDEE